MNPPSFRLLTVLALAFCAAAGAFAATEPAILAKARARLGPEATLNAVKTIHYVGTITLSEAANPGKTVTQALELYLEKPGRQRQSFTSAEVSEVTVLDGYDGWRRVTNLKNKQWTHSVLGPQDIKALQAEVWENLAYFRGIDKVKGWLKDLGHKTIDGVDCQGIGFYHSDTLMYLRYFDAATGRLVMTGTDDNYTKEQGEMLSGGIRFPRSLTITRTFKGQVFTQTITWTKIMVNEDLPDSLFAAPLPTVNR